MTDPFSLFGIAPRYELDKEELASLHKTLSVSAHPDRLRSDRAERRAALSKSIDLNQAYRILKDPVARAEALLKLLGHTELLEVKVEEDFLFEMLELREELSSSAAKKDRPRVEGLLRTASERRHAADATLAYCFSSLGADAAASELTKLGRAISVLRYLRRFEDEAKSLLDEL